MADNPNTYVHWFDIAKVVRENRRPHLYRDGVERAAALAALTCPPGAIERQIRAVEKVFYQYQYDCRHDALKFWAA